MNPFIRFGYWPSIQLSKCGILHKQLNLNRGARILSGRRAGALTGNAWKRSSEKPAGPQTIPLSAQLCQSGKI